MAADDNWEFYGDSCYDGYEVTTAGYNHQYITSLVYGTPVCLVLNDNTTTSDANWLNYECIYGKLIIYIHAFNK